MKTTLTFHPERLPQGELTCELDDDWQVWHVKGGYTRATFNSKQDALAFIAAVKPGGLFIRTWDGISSKSTFTYDQDLLAEPLDIPLLRAANLLTETKDSGVVVKTEGEATRG